MSQCQKLWYDMKGVTTKTHVKYESPAFHGS